MVEVVFKVVRTAFEEDEAVLFSVGHDIRSCAAVKLLKLVNQGRGRRRCRVRVIN